MWELSDRRTVRPDRCPPIGAEDAAARSRTYRASASRCHRSRTLGQWPEVWFAGECQVQAGPVPAPRTAGRELGPGCAGSLRLHRWSTAHRCEPHRPVLGWRPDAQMGHTVRDGVFSDSAGRRPCAEGGSPWTFPAPSAACPWPAAGPHSVPRPIRTGSPRDGTAPWTTPPPHPGTCSSSSVVCTLPRRSPRRSPSSRNATPPRARHPSSDPRPPTAPP